MIIDIDKKFRLETNAKLILMRDIDAFYVIKHENGG
jgi:hypothetical protein